MTKKQKPQRHEEHEEKLGKCMTKDEAIQIANEYMKKKGGFPYQFIYAYKRTKDDRTFWHVSYQFIFPEGRAMEPGSTILKIDMETKEVSAIPLM